MNTYKLVGYSSGEIAYCYYQFANTLCTTTYKVHMFTYGTLQNTG